MNNLKAKHIKNEGPCELYSDIDSDYLVCYDKKRSVEKVAEIYKKALLISVIKDLNERFDKASVDYWVNKENTIQIHLRKNISEQPDNIVVTYEAI